MIMRFLLYRMTKYMIKVGSGVSTGVAILISYHMQGNFGKDTSGIVSYFILRGINLHHALYFQDLPNYAQHSVPIFSLPQEWLWCESWCGNATKSKAKTIDLCNNPMTKEPKLQVLMIEQISPDHTQHHILLNL